MSDHADTIRREADELSAICSMRQPTQPELERIRDTLLEIPALLAERQQAIDALRELPEQASAITSIGHGLYLGEPVNAGSLAWANSAFALLEKVAALVKLGEKP